MFVCLFVKTKVEDEAKIEYADLDLVKSHDDGTGTVNEKSAGNRSTEYQYIDWLKTKALTNTRNEVETGRKLSEKSLDG